MMKFSILIIYYIIFSIILYILKIFFLLSINMILLKNKEVVVNYAKEYGKNNVIAHFNLNKSMVKH